MARNLNGVGPQITWANIIATLALFATVAGGAWLLIQGQVSGLQQQIRAADEALALQLRDNREEIDRLRRESVLRAEHIEFVKRLDGDLASLQRRLDVIETTRPTTGELQSRAASLKGEIDELKERIKWLEQAPRPK